MKWLSDVAVWLRAIKWFPGFKSWIYFFLPLCISFHVSFLHISFSLCEIDIIMVETSWQFTWKQDGFMYAKHLAYRIVQYSVIIFMLIRVICIQFSLFYEMVNFLMAVTTSWFIAEADLFSRKGLGTMVRQPWSGISVWLLIDCEFRQRHRTPRVWEAINAHSGVECWRSCNQSKTNATINSKCHECGLVQQGSEMH